MWMPVAGVGALVDARILEQRGHASRRCSRGSRSRSLRVGRLDRGLVDADHLAVDVDQRAAGVAGIDRRRGLEQAFEVDLAAAFGRDRLGAVEGRTTPTVTVCWSSSGSPIAIAHWPCSSCRVGQFERRRQLRVVVDLDDRDVGADVGGDDVRRHLVAVGEHDRRACVTCPPVGRRTTCALVTMSPSRR